MPTAKITGIASGINVQAQDVSGTWRALADGALVYDQEVLEARSNGPRFNATAYTLQKRVATVWTDAVVVTLDARRGSSHWRQDKFQIQGDDSYSGCALILTVRKGDRQVQHDLITLQVEQTDRGGRFRYPGGDYDLVTPITLKGLFSGLDKSNTLEMGGFEEGIEAQIVTDREQWATAGQTPEVGRMVLWHDNATAYLILKVEVDEISFVLGLGSVNK